MTSLTRAAKSEITSDWSQCFPGLGVYRPMHLLRRTGSLLIGILLERDSGNSCYRPTFHVHCLCRSSSTIYLILAQPLLTMRTNAPQSIRVSHHKDMYCEAAERLKLQSPLSLAGDVHFRDVLDAYEKFKGISGILRYQLEVLEDPILLATWLGNHALADQLSQNATQELKRWPQLALERIDNLNVLLARWENVTSQVNELRSIVASEIRNLEIDNLPVTDLLA
jgi:hypothetical protein